MTLYSFKSDLSRWLDVSVQHITLALYSDTHTRIRLLRIDARDRTTAREYIAVHLYIPGKSKNCSLDYRLYLLQNLALRVSLT